MRAPESFDYSGLPQEQREPLRRLADHIDRLGCQGTEAAAELGKMLSSAKERLQHGQFVDWCEREAGYRPRKAQLLMNLAVFAIKEPAVLRIPVTAGYMLAAPAAPQHIVQKVLSRARDGGRVKVAWVETLFDAETEKEPKPERSQPSEVTRIARLLASAVGPGQATVLRKLLEAAGATYIQHFVSDLQARLQDKLHDTKSFSDAVHDLPAAGL